MNLISQIKIVVIKNCKYIIESLQKSTKTTRKSTPNIKHKSNSKKHLQQTFPSYLSPQLRFVGPIFLELVIFTLF